MASDDSEDEIFIGSVICFKERKKMEKVGDRKTLIIDGSAGPLYRPPRDADNGVCSSRNNSLVVDHGIVSSTPLSMEDCCPTSEPSSCVSAATPTCPRESLLTVQQVLGEAGCPSGMDCDQEVLKQDGLVNSSATIPGSAMDCCKERKEQAHTCQGYDMDGNYVEAASNIASDALSLEHVTDFGMSKNSAQKRDDETLADSHHVSSLSIDLKCTNEGSICAIPGREEEDSVSMLAYNPQPPFDFSKHVTGLDQQELVPLRILPGSDALANEILAVADEEAFLDFNHHDPSQYHVPAVPDYSYLSNRFSIISTATEIGDGGNISPLNPSIPGTTINTTALAERDAISPSLAINDTKSKLLEDQENLKILTPNLGDRSASPVPLTASVSTMSFSSLAVNSSLSSETSLKTNPSLTSVQSFMVSSLVTPPPSKSLVGRLALKVPSFSGLSSDEVVTPPPAPLREPCIAEEAGEGVATPRPVMFGLSEEDFLEDADPEHTEVDRDNSESRSSAARVSERASPIMSVEDLSRMLDNSSLNLLADVALAEHEESLSVVEKSFKRPDGTPGCFSGAEQSKFSRAPLAATPEPKDLGHYDASLSSNKFINEYMSPRPVHHKTPSVTPGSASSHVATPRSTATTPCSPAREKFFAFARQWKEENSAQRSPSKCSGDFDADTVSKHRVIRNMSEELGTADELMEISEDNKLSYVSTDPVGPKVCPTSSKVLTDTEEIIMLNVRDGAAHVVRAIEDGEENKEPANLTKPRMSYFSALDVIDVGKRELFGTFITEEGKEGNRTLNDVEDVTSQDKHVVNISVDFSTIESGNKPEHGLNETSKSVESRTAISNGHVDAQPGPSGMQAAVNMSHSSNDDTSYLEDYPSDYSRGPYDTSYDSRTEQHFNDTLEQMELLLQASEKYKLEQAVLQQELALTAAVQATKEKAQLINDQEKFPTSVDGNESDRGSDTPSVDNESNLSCDGLSVDDVTLANESISICDVAIDETNDGDLEGLAEGDMEDNTSSNDVDDYTVLSPKKRTVASEVFDAAFNPTMGSTHASCARLTPEFPTITAEYGARAPTPDVGRLPQCLPPVLENNNGSIEDPNGKVVIGNACVVEECEEFDESTDQVENNEPPTSIPTVRKQALGGTMNASFSPASSSGGSKETPVKPPRKINAVKVDIKSLPIAVVSPSISRSSNASREISAGGSDASNDKNVITSSGVQRSTNTTNTVRSQSGSRLHLISPGSTKTTPSISMNFRRSPVSGSRVHSTQNSLQTPNTRINIHKPSSTGNIPRSVDTKTSSSQSPFKTPSRPLTTRNKYPSTSFLVAPRSYQTSHGSAKTALPNLPSSRYLTPQSRPVVRQVPGVLTTGSARKVHVSGAKSGSRVKQLAACSSTPASRVMSPVARSLLVNPPPPLLTTVKPLMGITEYRLLQQQSPADSSQAVPTSGTPSASSVRHGSMATPRRIPAKPSGTMSRLNQMKVQEDLNSSMQQRVAKIERIQKGLDRLTAKSPQVSSPAPTCLESPSCPPPSPTSRRCPTLPPAFYSQPSNLCLDDNKENDRFRRPCCAQGDQAEEAVEKPQVLRHTGRVLMPKSSEAANSSQSMMEVSVCERHSITYTDTLRAKQQQHH